MNKVWIAVVNFYRRVFRIPPIVVEMVASYNILLLCASGSSNEEISTYLDIDINSVRRVIKKFYGFDGWGRSLSISPVKIYKDGAMGGIDIESEMRAHLGDAAKLALRCCRRLMTIKRLIDEFWK